MGIRPIRDVGFKQFKLWWEAVSTDTVLHYAALAAILLVGTWLRFNHLELKALWLDEVITALFSLGHSYQDVPLEQIFSVETLESLFAFQPGVSDPEIIERIVTQSTHPPMFFLLMYRWMGWLQPSLDELSWALRSLPALFGVGAIAALYVLNRIAFSPIAGLWGAACMAVSPFAVYLSQEARHYTLPVLLTTLSLIGLVQIQQDLQRQRFRPWVWLGWVSICSFGLYVHYFFILALMAQLAALLSWMIWQRRQILTRGWMAVALAIAGLALVTLPWLPILLGHSGRPETDWLEIRNNLEGYLAPIYQTLIGWVLMVMILPVESQPLAIAIPSALLMLGCVGWIASNAWRGVLQIWQQTSYRAPLFLVSTFTLAILLEFCVIIYGLGKDLTVAPRYNFVYYPGVCALLGVALAGLVSLGQPHSPPGRSQTSRRLAFPLKPPVPSLRAPILVLLVGILSSLLVTHNLAFIKTYDPKTASQLLYKDSARPLMLVVSYNSLQDIALGLSNALTLRQTQQENGAPLPPQYLFLSPAATATLQWQKISNFSPPLPLPFNLWLAALPGALSEEFPTTPLTVQAKTGGAIACPPSPQRPDRIGFYYRLYHCNSGSSFQP